MKYQVIYSICEKFKQVIFSYKFLIQYFLVFAADCYSCDGSDKCITTREECSLCSQPKNCESVVNYLYPVTVTSAGSQAVIYHNLPLLLAFLYVDLIYKTMKLIISCCLLWVICMYFYTSHSLHQLS